MKKLFFVFAILACFASCNSFIRHDFCITNNSSQKVEFKLIGYGDEVYSLDSKESITLDLYDNPKVELQNNERVRFISGQSSGEFKDAVSYECIFYNHTESKVIVTETKNNLDENVELEASRQIINGDKIETEIYQITSRIYSLKPDFKAYYEDKEFACNIEQKNKDDNIYLEVIINY